MVVVYGVLCFVAGVVATFIALECMARWMLGEHER